jgi:hypothetical protein
MIDEKKIGRAIINTVIFLSGGFVVQVVMFPDRHIMEPLNLLSAALVGLAVFGIALVWELRQPKH